MSVFSIDLSLNILVELSIEMITNLVTEMLWMKLDLVHHNFLFYLPIMVNDLLG